MCRNANKLNAILCKIIFNKLMSNFIFKYFACLECSLMVNNYYLIVFKRSSLYKGIRSSLVLEIKNMNMEVSFYVGINEKWNMVKKGN